MFAPPPPRQLSASEIQSRLAARKKIEQRLNSAREADQNARASRENSRKLTHPPTAPPGRPPPISPPPPLPPPPMAPPPPPPTPIRTSRHPQTPRPLERTESAPTKTSTIPSASPRGFASEPRKAATPPKRPPRPPSELSITSTLSSPAEESRPVKTHLQARSRSPAGSIAKRAGSPFRRVLANWQSEEPARTMSSSTVDVISRPGRGVVSAGDMALRSAPLVSRPDARQVSPLLIPAAVRVSSVQPRGDMSSVREGSPARITHRGRMTPGDPPVPAPLLRSSTAPPAFNRRNSMASTKTVASGLSTKSAGANIRKQRGPAHRANTTQSGRGTKLEVEVKKRGDAIAKSSRLGVASDTLWRPRRKRKGETMSMLVDAGFFPIEELIYGNPSTVKKMRESQMYRINLPPRLTFIDKSLPTTPFSPPFTPTELISPTTPTSPRMSIGYGPSPAMRRTMRASTRRSGMARRSPLAQITENEVSTTTNDNTDEEEQKKWSEKLARNLPVAHLSEGRRGRGDCSSGGSGATTPTATHIHLRGGSVVTIQPPELTAWKPSVYIHGPIKLPTPAIMPRKNSVASLEAFQGVVDQMYQSALAVPRRRSDDAVVDDICDFFDDYEFGLVIFAGDPLAPPLSSVTQELDEIDEEETDGFGTPLSPSPMEVVVAQEVLSVIADVPYIPPVETEAMLRARGIARLSRGSGGSMAMAMEGPAERRESLTLGGHRTSGVQMALFPAPEESMLRPGPPTSPVDVSNRFRAGKDDSGSKSGKRRTQRFEVESEVAEMAANSSWSSGGGLEARRKAWSKASVMEAGKTRSAMTKIRRFVQRD